MRPGARRDIRHIGADPRAGKIKALIPLLLRIRQDVLIGDSPQDPRLAVTIEPLAGGAAGELRRMLREHLAGPCC